MSQRWIDKRSIFALTKRSMHTSRKERVVIVGSGWGGYLFLQQLDRKRYDVTVVSPSNHFVFTPLLPSTAVGTLEFRCIQEPVRVVPSLKSYYQAKVSAVDFEQKSIRAKNIFIDDKVYDIPYDYLVLACGCKTNTFNTPGIAEREGKEVFFLKHLYHARSIRNRILECFEHAASEPPHSESRKKLLSFVVVGGGPTSIEFVGELHDFVFSDISKWYVDLIKDVRITIVESSQYILGSFDRSLASYVTGVLGNRKIQVKTSVAVKGFDHERSIVRLSDGTEMDAGTVIWSAGLQPVKLVSETLASLEKGKGGRLVIDDQLRIQTPCKSIFAIGDCAINPNYPLPPIAQGAKQQARHLAKAFNQHELNSDGSLRVKPFIYYSLGSMVTWGGFRGALDLSSVGKKTKESDLGYFAGVIAYLTWRSAYWGMQTSWTNKLLIPMHWLKSFVFGRDISRF